MKLMNIPLSQIQPNKDNPRKMDIVFEDDKLSYLMDSVKKFGVMVPVVVTPRSGGYFLIDGERRYHAAKAVGLKSLPAYVLEKPEGGGLAQSELLYRMFQIHHLREQWGAIQQCFALENTYSKICKSKSVSSMTDDLAKFNAVVKQLAKTTGIETRTAGDRVKFLRWPKSIKNQLYSKPNRGAYSYILEIEDKIIIPALSNYPEYFEKVSVDDVREDLFRKLDDSLTHAQEVRHVAAYFRTPLSKASDKKRIASVLNRLTKKIDMTYEDAREELEGAFPDIVLSEPPSPRILLGMLEKLDAALNQFDIESVKTATHRSKASPADLVNTANSLRDSLANVIDELEGMSTNG